MTSPWSFDGLMIRGARPGAPLLGPVLALILAFGAPHTLAHPDLLAQIEAIDRLLDSEPDRVDLLARRSDLNRRHGDYEAAAADLAAARGLSTDYSLLDFFEGQLLLETGDPAGAERALDRYIAAEPGQASGWALRARARLARGQPARAAEDFGAAVDHANPGSPALYRDWALALVAAGETRWPAAETIVKRGLESFPRDPALLSLGADLALAQNQPAQAGAYIRRLPEAALRIPAWAERDARRQCLQEGEPKTSECLGDARRHLSELARLPQP